VLNESTLAKGQAQGGAARGVVVLDQAITLDEGRQYRLAIRMRQHQRAIRIDSAR